MHDDSCALILETTAWKTLRTACANLRAVIDAGLHAYFEEYLAEAERLLADNDQRGFYKHLKGTVGLGGRKARSEQFIICLLYTSPSPRDQRGSRMPSSA